MTVWVIYDRLYECVVAVHATKQGVEKHCDELNKKDGGYDDYAYNYDEFIVEE